MDPKDRHAAAERLHRAGVRKMIVFSAAFVIWQLLFFTVFPDRNPHLRTVDMVRTFAFLAWSAALLVLFATGGTMFRGRDVREFIDDERAQSLRAISYRTGFWAMVAVCFAAYVASMLVQLSAAEVAHLSLSGGILGALCSQIILERR